MGMKIRPNMSLSVNPYLPLHDISCSRMGGPSAPMAAILIMPTDMVNGNDMMKQPTMMPPVGRHPMQMQEDDGVILKPPAGR